MDKMLERVFGYEQRYKLPVTDWLYGCNLFKKSDIESIVKATTKSYQNEQREEIE